MMPVYGGIGVGGGGGGGGGGLTATTGSIQGTCNAQTELRDCAKNA